MIIFDTSIWIDALNGKKTPAVSLLVEKTLTNEVVLLPVIIQEVLQGIKEDIQFEKVKASLNGFLILDSDPTQVAIGAAHLYRNLRKKGITVRKPNDCLIAYAAILHNLQLVHKDSDFDLIRSYSELNVLEV